MADEVKNDMEETKAEEEKRVEPYETVSKLNECSVYLDGETVLPKPRVSREALISVLKEHNHIIGMLRVDLGSMSTFLQKVALDASETRVLVNGIKDELKIHRADLDSVTERTNAMEQVTSSLEKRLEEVDELANTVEAQGKHLKALQGEFDNEVDLNTEFRMSTEKRLEEESERTSSLEVTREAMQERLDHMHEEIQITTDQIIFTREPGEGEVVEDPTDLDLILTHVLVELREKAISHSNILEIQRKVLRNHGDELERKAKIEVEDFVRKHDEHLTRIQKKMDADADVDLSDIRRNQESITTTLEAVQAGMLEKTDKVEVDAKIEHKYEEILDHLQTALHATEEDEDDFKSATEALNKAIEDLRSTKVDRKEFGMLRQKIKELEEKVRKGGGSGGGGGGGGGVSSEVLEEYPTREELADALEEKVAQAVHDEVRFNLDRRVTALEANAANSMTMNSSYLAPAVDLNNNVSMIDNNTVMQHDVPAMNNAVMQHDLPAMNNPVMQHDLPAMNNTVMQHDMPVNIVDSNNLTNEIVPPHTMDPTGMGAAQSFDPVPKAGQDFTVNEATSNILHQQVDQSAPSSHQPPKQVTSARTTPRATKTPPPPTTTNPTVNGGNPVPAPYTGPHSPSSFVAQKPHQGSLGMVEGTAVTVTVGEGFPGRPVSSSTRNNRPMSSSSSALGNTVGMLSSQVNQLAVSVSRIEMRLGGGFNGHGSPRDFSNPNRSGSAPTNSLNQPNSQGVGGHCLSCDSPITSMNNTGASTSLNGIGVNNGSYNINQGNNGTGGGGFHFPPNNQQVVLANNGTSSGYLPAVPDAMSVRGASPNRTFNAKVSSKGVGSTPIGTQIPQSDQPGDTRQQPAGTTATSLPVIDRGTYFAQHREVPAEMMGVRGVDGRLYRSDVPKALTSGTSSSSRGKSKFQKQRAGDEPPQLDK